MVLINDNSTALSIGALMPHFTLPAAGGSTVNSTTITVPVIAVIFTCNHCPYAQAYEERLVELGKEFPSNAVQFILINSNDAANYPDDSFAMMKIRAQERGFPFSYCHDESQAVAKAYGALCTPHCFVFDQARTLQYKGRVDDNWKESSKVQEHSLHDAIAALVAGKLPYKKEANAIGCSIKWK